MVGIDEAQCDEEEYDNRIYSGQVLRGEKDSFKVYLYSVYIIEVKGILALTIEEQMDLTTGPCMFTFFETLSVFDR